MKNYDYAKAKRIIEGRQSLGFDLASLGMKEDWWWTAEDVWVKEKGFLVDLDDKRLLIGGIGGSRWATPVLCLRKRDSGKEIFVECYIEDGSAKGDVSPLMNDSVIGNYGELSGPRQRNVDTVKVLKESDL